MDATHLSLVAGWIGIAGGILSGALIGLFFHREQWLGGYNSYRRRLYRLGHISFFGIGFINLFFALSASMLHLSPYYHNLAAGSLIIGAITMPLICFLSGWKQLFRHLFFIPVVSITIAVGIILSSF
jgi:hypothetical protein